MKQLRTPTHKQFHVNIRAGKFLGLIIFAILAVILSSFFLIALIAVLVIGLIVFIKFLFFSRTKVPLERKEPSDTAQTITIKEYSIDEKEIN